MGGTLLDKLISGFSSCVDSVEHAKQSPSSHTASARQSQPISWSDIPTAILAQSLSCLSFQVSQFPLHLLHLLAAGACSTGHAMGDRNAIVLRFSVSAQHSHVLALVFHCLQERCQCTLVCSNWRSIIYSAAAHARDQTEVPLADTRSLPCDVYATEEQQQLKLQQCRAICYAPSAALTLNEFAPTTMQQLTSLTRLVLIDPDVLRQQLDGEAFVHTPLKAAVPVGLHQLTKLQVLSVAMRSPLLDVSDLPHSLVALHLDFSSGNHKLPRTAIQRHGTVVKCSCLGFSCGCGCRSPAGVGIGRMRVYTATCLCKEVIVTV